MIFRLEVALACIVLVLVGVLLYRILGEPSARARQQNRFDLIAYLERLWAVSQRTFGPGERTATVCAHIRKELEEVEKNPHDVLEWVDVLLLAFDGAARAGFTPEQICEGLTRKLSINERRKWPDWHTVAPDKPIEHEREETTTTAASASAHSTAAFSEPAFSEPVFSESASEDSVAALAIAAFEAMETDEAVRKIEALDRRARKLMNGFAALTAELRRLDEERAALTRDLLARVRRDVEPVSGG